MKYTDILKEMLNLQISFLVTYTENKEISRKDINKLSLFLVRISKNKLQKEILLEEFIQYVKHENKNREEFKFMHLEIRRKYNEYANC